MPPPDEGPQFTPSIWDVSLFFNVGIGSEARLHIPAGILRIPAFSVPVAFFSQESSAVTFLERHQETCLYGAYDKTT